MIDATVTNAAEIAAVPSISPGWPIRPIGWSLSANARRRIGEIGSIERRIDPARATAVAANPFRAVVDRHCPRQPLYNTPLAAQHDVDASAPSTVFD